MWLFANGGIGLRVQPINFTKRYLALAQHFNVNKTENAPFVAIDRSRNIHPHQHGSYMVEQPMGCIRKDLSSVRLHLHPRLCTKCKKAWAKSSPSSGVCALPTLLFFPYILDQHFIGLLYFVFCKHFVS